MSWLTGGLMLGGAVLDWMGSESEQDAIDDAADAQAAELARVAKANKELSYQDAKTALRMGQKRRFQADAQSGIMYNNLQKLLSTQRTRYAKSGVNLKEGSPVDVMEATTEAAAKDIMNVKYQGKSAQAEANSLARRYVTLAENGMRDAAAQASLIQDAANDATTASKWDQYSSVFNTAYQWYQVS